MSPGREANQGWLSLQDGRKQLLPGILDEITLLRIAPKLPWKTFYVLSSVSHAWLQEIRARQIYNARVVSHSAETLVIINDYIYSVDFSMVALRSQNDHFLTRLPPIPYHGEDNQWVGLDGKLYLVAGQELQPEGDQNRRSIYLKDCKKMFVFDVAGQGQWKECASMIETRTDFGCGVMHGKIYVFGGLPVKHSFKTPSPSPFCGSEVYDPKEDSWSPISPMITRRFDHRVEAVGDELFVLGGNFCGPDYLPEDDSSNDEEDQTAWPKNYRPTVTNRYRKRFRCREANFIDVYHPVKDEWRVVNPDGKDNASLFVAGGKLYSMDSSRIDLYDAKDDSWTHLHSFSIPIPWPADSYDSVAVSSVVAVDDELLAWVWWRSKDDKYSDFCYFKSIGLGSESKEIMWQTQVPNSPLVDDSNRLIQL